MAKLKVELAGKDVIDNAVIFFDDPQEKIAHYLNPDDDKNWSADDISVPMDDDDELDYSLHVVAYTGTGFTCTITNKGTDKTIVFSDVTGKVIKNRSVTKGAKKFS
jgi:hypothetical protein